MRDLLSVVIPAFNAGRYLPETLASVQRQRGLDECSIALQIIVVDDGSTDDTREVVSGVSGVEYVYQPRAGASAARNAGVQHATGALLAFLDADDCWAADKIQRQRRHLGDDSVDMVFGHATEFSTGTQPSNPVQGSAIPARCAGTMLTTRDAFLRAGPFSAAWKVGEFVDWFLRASERGLRSAMLPDVVLYRRLHADNAGRSAGGNRSDYVHIIKQALDRRRQVDR